MAKTFKIFSIRHSVAQGNHWQHERDCQELEAQQWLDIFRKDEPNVTFIASTRKPARP